MSNQNCIALHLAASLGLPHVGLYFLPVPADGVPADILVDVGPYLHREDSGYSGPTLDVTAPTWDAVRVAVEQLRAKAAAERAARAERKAQLTSEWRGGAARYLAGEKVFIASPDGDVYCGAHASDTSVTPEEIQAVRDEYRRREAVKRAERTARVRADLPRFLADEISGIDGARDADLTADERALIDQHIKERDDRKAAEKAALEKARAAERDAWIRAHGSARLQKGLAAGMVDSMLNVYLDERIRHDLGPDWANWQTAPEPDSHDRLNPTEAELDALTDARKRWPKTDAQLRSVGGEDKRGIRHPWRPAILMDCPWDKRETAIHYVGDIDADDSADDSDE